MKCGGERVAHMLGEGVRKRVASDRMLKRCGISQTRGFAWGCLLLNLYVFGLKRQRT